MNSAKVSSAVGAVVILGSPMNIVRREIEILCNGMAGSRLAGWCGRLATDFEGRIPEWRIGIRTGYLPGGDRRGARAVVESRLSLRPSWRDSTVSQVRESGPGAPGDYAVKIEISANCPNRGIELSSEYGTFPTTCEKGKTLSPKNKYLYLGKMYPGETVAFESTSEPFSQYTLADGTSVKVKMILLDAVRLDAYDEQGNPVYQFQFQQILGIVAPDSLKGKVH